MAGTAWLVRCGLHGVAGTWLAQQASYARTVAGTASVARRPIGARRGRRGEGGVVKLVRVAGTASLAWRGWHGVAGTARGADDTRCDALDAR